MASETVAEKVLHLIFPRSITMLEDLFHTRPGVEAPIVDPGHDMSLTRPQNENLERFTGRPSENDLQMK